MALQVAPIDETTWWLVVELDGIIKCSVNITVSGRERAMNSPLQFKQLLAARFDKAARQVREEFLILA
jgi:hypothetical protein